MLMGFHRQSAEMHLPLLYFINGTVENQVALLRSSRINNKKYGDASTCTNGQIVNKYLNYIFLCDLDMLAISLVWILLFQNY